MSKLIIEMEMPVKEWNCLDCKAICTNLMRGYYCGITKKTIDTLKNMRARPDWCPIKGEISEIELIHLENERAFAARNIAAERKDDDKTGSNTAS